MFIISTMRLRPILLALLLVELIAATWWLVRVGDSQAAARRPFPPFAETNPFTARPLASFDEPWAMAIVPGTTLLVITERGGSIKTIDMANGRLGTVTGAPKVAYGGQGGLGDIAFLPSESATGIDARTIYLSWAEAGQGNMRGAALGRGTMKCPVADECRIKDFTVIWRQDPKTTGDGHYSHRIAFSPDGKTLFLASGDRQKMAPAQDLSQNLGKVLRLNLDGTPAPGNPFAAMGGISPQVWSYGHRNVLGLKFDAQGRLWDLEHGPRGGDELNLVEPGRNYGWPLVSDGDHYDGRSIPRHATRPDLAGPAISWNPVIAPGDFIFASGRLWPEWRGQALIAGMGYPGLVRVGIDGTAARELARYPFGARIRTIAERADGALLVLEDGEGGRLLELLPRKP